MRKIMILGAGLYQVPLIETARRMGFETIAVSIPGPYRGFEVADRALEIDTRDREAILKAAYEEGISGICTTGTDVAVSSIGYVCDRMQLPGIGYEAAQILCDKARMKEAFLKGRVSCAEGRRVTTFAEARDEAEKLGYPVVVKRVDSSGSRGITVVTKEDKLKSAYLHAREKTMHDYVLVEKFLTGTEIGVDGYVKGGRVVFLAPHGKYVYEGTNTTVPVGHYFPLQGSLSLMEDIHRQIQLAVDASGADNCCLNADVFVQGDRCYIIEMGGRCGATCIPELISCHYGFDYYEQMVRGAVGDKVEFPPENAHRQPCMARLLLSRVSGVITDIDQTGLDKIRSDGFRVSVDFPVGGHVYAMSDGTDRIGSVLSGSDDEEALKNAVMRAYRCIKVNGKTLEEIWKN